MQIYWLMNTDAFISIYLDLMNISRISIQVEKRDIIHGLLLPQVLWFYTANTYLDLPICSPVSIIDHCVSHSSPSFWIQIPSSESLSIIHSFSEGQNGKLPQSIFVSMPLLSDDDLARYVVFVGYFSLSTIVFSPMFLLLWSSYWVKLLFLYEWILPLI